MKSDIKSYNGINININIYINIDIKSNASLLGFVKSFFFLIRGHKEFFLLVWIISEDSLQLQINKFKSIQGKNQEVAFNVIPSWKT